MIGVLMRSRIDGLEINEPLQRHGLGRTAAAVATARMSAVVRRRPLTIVTYAIENRAPFGKAANRSWKQLARLRVDQMLCRYVAREVDRIAYGTDSSRELYGSLLPNEMRRAVAVTIAALPAPCDCPIGARREVDRVIFLGALEERKGFRELINAWPRVLELWPRARLSIIGKGSLEALARSFAARNDSVNLVIDPPRTYIHNALRESALLVLLSQPGQTWREQVGLPIVEGLAHGCSIVTTQETGLAHWLKLHGHLVVSQETSAEGLAQGIVHELERRRSSESVLAHLPEVDGRLYADEWLFAGVG
jgi:glycosyltransferase involved in cell wall biosynthesis